MSLHGKFDWHDAPNNDDYGFASLIPEAERCPHCDGLRLMRTRNSDFGPNQGQDWQECFFCEGTGRKRERKRD